MISWYGGLYEGEKAKRRRSSIIRDIRQKKFCPDVYVLTPPSNENNVLDIYPAAVLYQEYYEKKNLTVLGIACGYGEALELAGRLVSEMYEETGGFRLENFLKDL